MIILRFREKNTAKSDKAHEASDNFVSFLWLVVPPVFTLQLSFNQNPFIL